MLRVSADGRLGIRLARAGVGGRENALAFSALREEQQAADDAEERRLFYVAMTRARERLVLSGAAKLDGWISGGATGGGPVAWIAPALFGELAPLIAEGGGVVQRGGVAVRLRIPDPSEIQGAGTGPIGPAWPPRASRRHLLAVRPRRGAHGRGPAGTRRRPAPAPARAAAAGPPGARRGQPQLLVAGRVRPLRLPLLRRAGARAAAARPSRAAVRAGAAARARFERVPPPGPAPSGPPSSAAC